MKTSSKARGRGPADSSASPRMLARRDLVAGEPTAGGTKLVRDSFTFPEVDHARLGELKQRALKAGREIKKSELLRAGLAALAAMPDAAFHAAIDGVERIKTGRPAK